MKAAAGCLVVILVAVASSAAQKADDKPAAATAATAAPVESVDGRANATTVAEKMATAHSTPTIAAHSGDISEHNGGGGGGGNSNDLGRALFASAVVFSGFALAAAFVWLVAPLFGNKFCAISGNCGGGSGVSAGNGEDSVVVSGGGVGGGGNEEASSLFPFSIGGYRYNNVPYGGYRKRSLRYVGPILQTLASAYEKFDEFSASTTPKAA